MKRRPLAAIALRCNLFRHKWQPDLCCAVPEHHPVPSFVTGEQWDFEGTWEGPISPPISLRDPLPTSRFPCKPDCLSTSPVSPVFRV
jgi:hypothetical protein